MGTHLYLFCGRALTRPRLVKLEFDAFTLQRGEERAQEQTAEKLIVILGCGLDFPLSGSAQAPRSSA
ncbi:hypothetical protein AOC05_08375 [Arthrobacter alpinus]|uniref:Uncharacterized protein n=1 Tax=Arthrobacter alpinus TaxID=656366 RepID=A0A0M3UG22_9MICC|nr:MULTISPECIES: hypothetical protein [Arthrobacter]ALE92335.1 hypothetical protein AOC05_08375 [Arthrobacter alpinus]